MGYAAQLVRCQALEPYDSCAEPTCCKTCTHNCQSHFNQEENFKIITQEIAGWWGPYATPAIQQSKLYQDILIGYDKLADKHTALVHRHQGGLQKFLCPCTRQT